MLPPLQKVELPLEYLLIPLGVLLALVLAARWRARFLAFLRPAPPPEKERDWSIPTLDSQAQGDSLYHRWDPRVKITTLLFFMFCTASLQHLPWAGAALLLAFLSVLTARIPLRLPWRRLKAMAAFLGMFLLVMPLTVPAKSGDILVTFTHLPFLDFNLRGFMRAVLICVKASAIALLVEPLISTAPFPVNVQALARMKIPPVVCQMILLAHRYIFVFQHEATRMGKGMSARGFRKRTNLETLQTVGNFLGMLLVRSFERTQRVHEAMLARGYDGRLPQTFHFKTFTRDWVMGAFWMAAGIALLLADGILRLPISPRM